MSRKASDPSWTLKLHAFRFLSRVQRSLINRLKTRPHQQQCRSNVWLCRINIRLCSRLLPKTATMSNEFIAKFRPFDKVECLLLRNCCRFGNNVAGFGTSVFSNNVERNFVLWTRSKQIEHVQFVATLSKGRNFVRHCCQKTATMSKQHSTLSKESFDL